MLRKLIAILLFCALPLSYSAASSYKKTLKKDIAQAKTFVKSGKNLDRAEQLMQQHLNDSANRRNERLWLIMFDAQRKQYEQGNMKLYLKQKYDTAAFFNIVKRMFTTLETFDSIDAEPNAKGESKPQYRRKHAEILDKHRVNLFNGGVYFVGKQKFSDAYQFLNLYLDCARQPLFTAYNYTETDERMPEAAYWATYCGYKMQQPDATLRYADLALNDTAHHSLTLQYLADTYKLQNDTAKYLETLGEGFQKYPVFPYFFPRLVDYHATQGNWNEVLALADSAIAADSTRNGFRAVRTTALLNLHQYDLVVRECDQLLAADSTMAVAWHNAGMAYFNQAVTIGKGERLNSKMKRQMTEKYRHAMRYMERYRQLRPERQDRWGLPLYTIYLNLNMGTKFDEIDRLLRSRNNRRN